MIPELGQIALLIALAALVLLQLFNPGLMNVVVGAVAAFEERIPTERDDDPHLAAQRTLTLTGRANRCALGVCD